MSNAFSRLVSNKSTLPEDHSKFDVLYVYVIQTLNYDNNNLYAYSIIMIEIDETFRNRFLQSYVDDLH